MEHIKQVKEHIIKWITSSSEWRMSSSGACHRVEHVINKLMLTTLTCTDWQGKVKTERKTGRLRYAVIGEVYED